MVAAALKGLQGGGGGSSGDCLAMERGEQGWWPQSSSPGGSASWAGSPQELRGSGVRGVVREQGAEHSGKLVPGGMVLLLLLLLTEPGLWWPACKQRQWSVTIGHLEKCPGHQISKYLDKVKSPEEIKFVLRIGNVLTLSVSSATVLSHFSESSHST